MLFATSGSNMENDGKFSLIPRMNNDTAWDDTNTFYFDYPSRTWNFDSLLLQGNEIYHAGNVDNMPISTPIQDALDTKANKDGETFTGNVVIGDGSKEANLTLRKYGNNANLICRKEDNTRFFEIDNTSIDGNSATILRSYISNDLYNDVIIEPDGNVSVLTSAPQKPENLARMDYVQTQVQDREPNLGMGAPNQVLSMNSTGTDKVWKDMTIPDGDFLSIDGSDPVQGNFTVGTGSVGDTLNIRGMYNNSYINFKKQNNIQAGSLLFSNSDNTLKMRVYDSAGQNIRTQLSLDYFGRVSISSTTLLLNENNLVHRKYIDDVRTLYFEKSEYLKAPSTDPLNDAGKPITLNDSGFIDSNFYQMLFMYLKVNGLQHLEQNIQI
jgi:hypothetical protein